MASHTSKVEVTFLDFEREPLVQLVWAMEEPGPDDIIILEDETVAQFDLPTNAYVVWGVATRRLHHAKPASAPIRIMAYARSPITEVVV